MEDDVGFLELTMRLGAWTPVLAALAEGYEMSEALERDDPHGHPWHTSFHASGMPAPGQGCVRRSVFDLMGLPDMDPVDASGRAIMDAGKDAEYQMVKRLAIAGFLISAHPDAELQTGFALKSHWLTGNCDAAVLLHGWKRPHIVELKGCDNEHPTKPKFKMLASGETEPDPMYVAQLQSYINLAHILGSEIWPELQPCETGSLVYFNRARPSQRLEFIFDRDPDWFKGALDLLEKAKRSFEAGKLPEHPFDGKGWSQPPCDYCEQKRDFCKPMWKNGVEDLDVVAQHIRDNVDESYDYEDRRTELLMRWAD